MFLRWSSQWGLTPKIVAITLLVSVPLWLALDRYQSSHLRALFIEKEYQKLELGANDDRYLFDQYAQAIFRSVKLIAGQKRFLDFIEAMPEADAAPEVVMAHQAPLPSWMPRSSLMRTFYRARYALLYDQNNYLRAAYHHGEQHAVRETLPEELLRSSSILRKLSHNQAYMTLVGEAPYLIASEQVPSGRGHVTLALVTPIDSSFLQEVVSLQNHHTVLALVDRETQRVVASSDLTRIPEGASVGELEGAYLMAGKSFFDYGASDLNLQLSSFAPKAAVLETINDLLVESNFQRAVLMAVMLATFMAIMLLFVRRVLGVGRTVNYYSKHILGRDISEHTEGDELKILGLQVDTLGKAVVTLRNELRLEAENANRMAADLEARTTSLTLTNDNLAREIDERMRAEAEREQLHKQLQKSQRMDAIGQITGGVAHDFNNILAAILGFVDLAEAKFGQAERSGALSRYLEQVTHAGKRGRDLVSSMMAFSRGEAGQRRVLAMEQDIHSVVGMLRPTISSSIEIRTLIRDKGLYVDFDPIKLQQVVMNLMVNARDSLEQEKGLIELSLGRSNLDPCRCSSCSALIGGDYIELSVRDTGKGIAAENISHIFEPFFSTKKVGDGSGMGLSVIHGIMHANHGHILVASEVGKGSRFRLLFKPSAETLSAMQLVEENLESTVGEGVNNCGHILVVDDEIALTSYLKDLLELQGYTVSTFNDPSLALALLRSEPDAFDLIVTDQTMPQLTGVELTEEVRQFNPHLPIVMCTGYSATTNEVAAKERGVDAFLTKPVDSKKLLAVIAGLLAERKAQSTLVR